MVTEKPPRRPKSTKEPVTIDMAAEETAAVAEPVRSNDTDDLASAEGEAPWNESSTTEKSAASEKPFDRNTGPEAKPSLEMPSKASGEKAPADDALDAPQAARDEASNEAKPAISSVPTPPERKPAATSTLIAAGIFGGIVALALAGSMQYAGYLPGAGGASNVTAELADLRRHVEAIDQAPTSAADPELSSRIQALEAALAQSANSDTAEQLSVIQREIASMRSAAESGAADSIGQVQQLQTRLEAVEAKLDEPGADAAAARAIAAAALQAAVDRGGSFRAELDTFAAVAPDEAALAQLQPLSENGVPSRPQLVERFQQTSDAILEAANRPDPEQGIAGRLVSSAMSVVKVRRTGEVEGDAPEAIVARMDSMLKGGDLLAASTEWEKLPEEAKIISQDFKQSLDARIAVDGLIADSLARAVSETGNRN